MKTCARCKSEKPLSNYYALKSGRHHSYCRDCCVAYQQTPQQKLVRNAAAKAHHEANRSKRKAYKRQRISTVPGLAWELLDNAQRRAAKYGWKIDIDREFVEKLLQDCPTCALTGWAFRMGGPEIGQRVNPLNPSLDRIDSGEGYTRDNVRLVCVQANIAKNDFTDDQLVALAQAIVRTISSQAVSRDTEGSTTRAKARTPKRVEAQRVSL